MYFDFYEPGPEEKSEPKKKKRKVNKDPDHRNKFWWDKNCSDFAKDPIPENYPIKAYDPDYSKSIYFFPEDVNLRKMYRKCLGRAKMTGSMWIVEFSDGTTKLINPERTRPRDKDGKFNFKALEKGFEEDWQNWRK